MCGRACGAGTQCLYGGCIDPNSVVCSPTATANRSCVRDANISLGKYWVNNNFWGVEGATGQQCIFSTCQTGDLVGWGTDWMWSGGQAHGVKTFTSLVFGWHWGWKVQNTGLPIQISSNRAINCGWDFQVNATGTFNVAYDIFTHTIGNPGTNDDPADEIMIWLHRAGGAGPIGERQLTVTIGGSPWDLHRGTNNVWNVFSFVRTSNAGTSVLNIMDFMRDLVTRGWLQSTKYVSTVQAGAEIFNGSGSVNTRGFYCRIP